MGTTCSREASTGAAGTAQEPQQRSECPISPQARSSAVYNVYNQRIDDPDSPTSSGRPWSKNSGLIDPSNNMPLEPHQQPIPGQRCLISTHREQSTIPKGGTDGTWLYPSPQMFFSALRRKGKGDDVEEADMESVVFAHNVLNEETWQRVAAWEKLHACECGNPSLLRFTGRPHNLSPLARMRNWLGGPLPFDRHDWYIDRCGKEVRYVIDFYFDDAKAGTPEAFEVVVRPGLDSLESALDRVKMSVYVTCAAYGLPCPITGHSSTVAAPAEGSSSGSAASAVAQPE